MTNIFCIATTYIGYFRLSERVRPNGCMYVLAKNMVHHNLTILGNKDSVTIITAEIAITIEENGQIRINNSDSYRYVLQIYIYFLHTTDYKISSLSSFTLCAFIYSFLFIVSANCRFIVGMMLLQCTDLGMLCQSCLPMVF